MPARTPTPCRARGCRAVTSDRSGYCEAHKSAGWSRYRNAKKNGPNPYGAKWQKLRTATLQRDRGLCVMCLADGRAVPATEVDHIIALAHGGKDELDNTQSLCTPCHRRKTATERMQHRRRG